MKAIGVLVVFALGSLTAAAQELGLKEYMKRLQSTPGLNIEQKVQFLSSMGVTLSDLGMRDLTRGTGSSSVNGNFDGTLSNSSPNRKPSSGFQPSWNSDLNFSGGDETAPDAERNSRNLQKRWTGGTSGTSSTYGNQTYHNLNNGVSGTSSTYGNQTYDNWNTGLSGTSSRYGNQTQQNWNNGVSGASSTYGNQTYHNLNNGVSGTSSTYGNQTYTNFNNGTACTTSRYGNQAYTTCNK